MIKEQISDYFQNQKAQFSLNFVPASPELSEESIHDYRVSIKRLRLLYRFLDFFSDKQFCAKRRANLLVGVFKSAGALRDVHILLRVIEQFHAQLQGDYMMVKMYFQDKEKNLQTEFKEKNKLSDLEKIEKQFVFSDVLLKVIVDFPGIQQAFDIYKKNCFQKVSGLLKNPQVDFHKIRKRVKALTYLTEIERPHQSEPTDKLLLLKFLGQLLGDWHDLEVFLEELASLKNKKKINMINFEETVKKLKGQQANILEKFYSEFDKLIL